MPSKSEKQKKFMNIAAHSKKFADDSGIPQEVAKEFVEADKKVTSKNNSQQKAQSHKPKQK